MSELSRREKIIELLEQAERPLSVDDIAHALGADPRNAKDIYEDLKHIAKTIFRSSKGSKRLLMLPPQCANCGYTFTDLKKPKKPSKCPRCRSQRILPPRFIIREV